MSFENLNLHPTLLKAVSVCDFKEPTDIQTQSIPVILDGQDVMASAPTGTGKTAAFVLPILHKLIEPSKDRSKGPRALILTPTRELAMQITKNIQQFARFGKYKTGRVVGGESYTPQEKLFREPLDILVATPGRLLDHFNKRRVDFSRLEVLVLDEADRMLDMGFIDDINAIANATPKNRQTLLFSATLEGKVFDVAKSLLKKPVRIQLASKTKPNKAITQFIHQADDLKHKDALLFHYLKNKNVFQAVIFTATKRRAETLTQILCDQGVKAAALHGDMKQAARKRTMEKMRRGRFQFLVATDVASRGLDIKGLTHVINYELPMIAEDYIHRIGRTGRCGETGIAVSLVGPDDWSKLNNIERFTKQKIDREVIEGLEPEREEPRAHRKQPTNRKRRPGAGAGGYKGKSSTRFGDKKKPQTATANRNSRSKPFANKARPKKTAKPRARVSS